MSEAPFKTALDFGVSRLYHYQSFNEKHVAAVVERGLVRFSSPAEFNDPWDCKPMFHFPDDPAGQAELIDWMDAASQKHTPGFDAQERGRGVLIFKRNPELLKTMLTAAEPEFWRQASERYRVYCLTTKPDHPLMWAHYADKHRGVCLEFNARTYDINAAIKVVYAHDYPEFRLDDNSDLSPLYTKAAEWSYEDEYRLIAEEEVAAFRAETIKTRDQFHTFPSGVLTAVIVGVLAPPATRDALKNIITRSSRPVLFREARMVPSKYELEIK